MDRQAEVQRRIDEDDPYVASVTNGEETMTLCRRTVQYSARPEDAVKPIDGAKISIEEGAAMESRVTAARVLTFGAYALAAKKQTGSKFLVVEGDDFLWSMEVPAKRVGDAARFRMDVLQAQKQLEIDAAATKGPEAPTKAVAKAPAMPAGEAIKCLAALRRGGVITQDDFDGLRRRVTG